MVSLSLVLPCYNEAQNIRSTATKALQWFDDSTIDGELIIVNDGSSDESGTILQEIATADERVLVRTHEHNRGYGAAVRTGLDSGTKEYLAFMDSDGQFDVTEFDRLLPEVAEYQFVTGRKIKRADPLVRKLNAKCYAALIGLLFNVWVHDINCAMKVFKKSLWPRIRPQYGLGALFNGEMYVRLKRNKVTWKQVGVHHYPRQFGEQTGADPRVIVRMFLNLWQLKMAMQKERKQK